MSIQHRVKALELRLRLPAGREFLSVTPEEYGAMVRDACERVLASLPDERTRALVDAVLGAKNWRLVEKELHELNLPLRPANYRDWPAGTTFLFVVAPKVAASVEEWQEMVNAHRRLTGQPRLLAGHPTGRETPAKRNCGSV